MGEGEGNCTLYTCTCTAHTYTRLHTLLLQPDAIFQTKIYAFCVGLIGRKQCESRREANEFHVFVSLSDQNYVVSCQNTFFCRNSVTRLSTRSKHLSSSSDQQREGNMLRSASSSDTSDNESSLSGELTRLTFWNYAVHCSLILNWIFGSGSREGITHLTLPPPPVHTYGKRCSLRYFSA